MPSHRLQPGYDGMPVASLGLSARSGECGPWTVILAVRTVPCHGRSRLDWRRLSGWIYPCSRCREDVPVTCSSEQSALVASARCRLDGAGCSLKFSEGAVPTELGGRNPTTFANDTMPTVSRATGVQGRAVVLVPCTLRGELIEQEPGQPGQPGRRRSINHGTAPAASWIPPLFLGHTQRKLQWQRRSLAGTPEQLLSSPRAAQDGHDEPRRNYHVNDIRRALHPSHPASNRGPANHCLVHIGRCDVEGKVPAELVVH